MKDREPGTNLTEIEKFGVKVVYILPLLIEIMKYPRQILIYSISHTP